jgi:ABC-type microcin C transport system duplicated ATPase subunit YejF
VQPEQANHRGSGDTVPLDGAGIHWYPNEQPFIPGDRQTVEENYAMIRKPVFAEVVEAVDQLCAEEQIELLRLLRQRLVDQDRKQLLADVAQSRADIEAGRVEPLDLDALTAELLR